MCISLRVGICTWHSYVPFAHWGSNGGEQITAYPCLGADKRIYISNKIDSGVICRKTKTDSEQLPELLLLYLSRSAVITPAAGQMSSAVLSQRKIVGCSREMVLSHSLCIFLSSFLPLPLWFSHLVNVIVCTSVSPSPFSIQWSYPFQCLSLFSLHPLFHSVDPH